jgi:hypothetical protein
MAGLICSWIFPSSMVLAAGERVERNAEGKRSSNRHDRMPKSGNVCGGDWTPPPRKCRCLALISRRLCPLRSKSEQSRTRRYARFVPISLQKSPRREARCALAPNTSLNLLRGTTLTTRQRDQRDLALTSHMRRTAEVAVRRAWPTCAGSERLLPA